jgi:hypothetical protein
MPYGSMDMIQCSIPLDSPTPVTRLLINLAAIIGLFCLANG